MSESSIPLGIWRSHYEYPSSSRQAEFEGEHFMRLHQKDNHLVFESVSKVSKSYTIVRLTIDEDVATGSWQEQTEPEGYYKGATYYGAIQLLISDDKKHMQGKWVGFGKDMKVNTGPWEFTYVGAELPEHLTTKVKDSTAA